jgi:hypothetical protein
MAHKNHTSYSMFGINLGSWFSSSSWDLFNYLLAVGSTQEHLHCILCKERGKDRERGRVLESFFSWSSLQNIGVKKITTQFVCKKKVKKRNCKSLLPLNLKKCIMVKTWGTYASWFDHNYLNNNKMLSWSCNDTYISWIPWIGNCFHLFGYFWTRNNPLCCKYLPWKPNDQFMLQPILNLGIYSFAH